MIKEEFFEEEPKWKKFLIMVVGLILLFLVTSYFLASYPLFPIIASLSESHVAQNESIVLDDFSIIFTQNTYEELQGYYDKDKSVEMVVCLKGEISNDYIIDEIYQPEMITQTYNHVTFKSCSTDSIILLHSQPFRHCIASEQDLITLEDVKQRNKDILMVIMCEPDRFSVYE
ncbi:hypothetical protein HOG16_03200 [Candidatus Woesearchaeota archaeon]|jgi:hypothetical protein|nr:hypothetical protein [Candidatus Woesearchaeota archaeon]MBT4322135.1 hypothetical protein [Candidatus Woesearchaeota archaeon]MBT4630971.1 hypothetical protein [Candidatus Woesearchaeota archaeon]